MLQQFLDLLAWIRARPHDYCRTVGEVEEILVPLYEICAAADGKRRCLARELAALLERHGLFKPEQLLSDEDRLLSLDEGRQALQRLVAFWTELDEPLGFPSPEIG